MDKIDFVLPWVDGSDPRWLAEKRSYENSGEAMARGDEVAGAFESVLPGKSSFEK